MKSSLLLIVAFICTQINMAFAQTDLLNLLESEQKSEREYATATFKGSRLINGHSVETKRNKEMDFLISHRFGTLNSGFYNFFGLDQAVIRLGLEYGLTENFTIGGGRNSFEKTYDVYGKYKILKQQKGTRDIPLSLVLFSSMAYKTLKNINNPEMDLSPIQRMTFTNQLLIARKFSQNFSLQLMPTYIHRNSVVGNNMPNGIYALGIGGRQKLNKRISLNGEYYYQFNKPDNFGLYNALAFGVDIETGGHVFQLHMTNSRAMIEKGFITETTGNWAKGDIHFGFNISRSFQWK
jgi:hypothetical protein